MVGDEGRGPDQDETCQATKRLTIMSRFALARRGRLKRKDRTMDLIYSGQLTVEICWCGIRHAVPQELVNHQYRQQRDGEKQTSIYCPLGHEWIRPGEGRAAELERHLTRERAAHDQTKAAKQELERSLQATRGVVTRTKNRIKNGVCPCCKRHFGNLHQHMKTQHPEYAVAE